jgi:hypothetical protein
MLRISERTLEIDDELCVCFIDWQKVFDWVNWTKLMQILKGTRIDWRERRLISNLYTAQSVKVRLNLGETRSVKIGRRIRQGCCLSPILFNLNTECVTKGVLEGFRGFKIGGQIIHTERIRSFQGGSFISHYVESWLWKRLWTCRKTDY